MTKKKGLIIGLILALSLVAYLAYEHYQKLEKDRYSYSVYTGKIRVKDYAFMEDGKAVALQVEEDKSKEAQKVKQYSPKAVESDIEPIGTSEQYVIFAEVNFKQNSLDSIWTASSRLEEKEGDVFNLVVYKKEGNALSYFKTLNLFKFKELNDSYVALSRAVVSLDNGNSALAVTVNGERKFIDIVNESVVNYFAFSGNKMIGSLLKNNLVFYDLVNFKAVGGSEVTSRYPFFGTPSLNPSGDAIDSTLFKAKGQSLPVYNKYPDAYKILISDRSSVALMVDTSVVDIKTDAEVIGLFNQDGFNGVFKGLTISQDNSIDGQERTVNNYDEFMQYYNFEKLNR